MKFNYCKYILPLGLFLLTSVGCGTIEKPATDKQQAKQLLNEGKYSAAIQILEELNTEKNRDYEVNLLLASAYAGDSAFNIVDSFTTFKPFIDSITNSANLVQSEEQSGESGDSSQPKIIEDDTVTADAFKDVERKLVSIVSGFSGNFQTFQKIPYIIGKERTKVVESIIILKQIPKESSYFARSKSYSAILNILQFLNYLRDSVDQPQKNQEPIQLLCNLDLFDFAKNADRSLIYLVDAVDDLEQAYKPSGKKMPKGLIEIRAKSKVVAAAFIKNKEKSDTSEIVSNFSKQTLCY